VIPAVRKEAFPFNWPINWLGLHREYLNVGEMEVIASILRDVEAKSVIELGCRDGRTARVLLHNVSAIHRYVGVDVTHDYAPALEHQRREMVVVPGELATADPRFELIVRPRGSLDVTAEELGTFDAAFIDGDHSAPVVESDARLARAIVRPGGVIIFHDYFNGAVDVMTAVDGLHAEGWPIKSVEGTWLAFCMVE